MQCFDLLIKTYRTSTPCKLTIKFLQLKLVNRLNCLTIMPMRKHLQIAFSVLVLLVVSCKTSRVSPPLIDGFNYDIKKKVIAENGAVVSAHALASKTGLAILKKGGNAVDAAIAMQLTLAVVYPSAGNLGGGGFMVAQLANGELVSIDYREMAPGSAHRNMYLDEAGNPLLDLSQHGHLSSGVPGTVAGLFASLKYAKLPMRELIQPAIDL